MFLEGPGLVEYLPGLTEKAIAITGRRRQIFEANCATCGLAERDRGGRELALGTSSAGDRGANANGSRRRGAILVVPEWVSTFPAAQSSRMEIKALGTGTFTAALFPRAASIYI